MQVEIHEHVRVDDVEDCSNRYINKGWKLLQLVPYYEIVKGLPSLQGVYHFGNTDPKNWVEHEPATEHLLVCWYDLVFVK